MDESRGQFTFYRSFWDAVSGLPKKDKLPLLEAIISYALDGTEPENLSKTQQSFFLLCRPTLDSSRKKSASGKQGGSKPKANRMQTAREIEGENEKEKEYECKKKQEAFERFWSLYPRKVNKPGAKKAFEKVDVAVEVLLRALDNHKRSAQWKKNGGEFIPHPTTWLNQRRWEESLPADNTTPKGATGALGEAELEAIKHAFGEV